MIQFTEQTKTMLYRTVTNVIDDVLKEDIKQLDARKLVPFMSKGEPWANYLEYYATRGFTDIEIKNKKDTTSNNISIQITKAKGDILRFPVTATMSIHDYMERTHNRKNSVKIIDKYWKETIEEGYVAYDLFVNEWCLKGKGGFPGLVNDPDVFKTTMNAKIKTAPAETLFSEVMDKIHLMSERTNKKFVANQVALPTQLYKRLANSYIGNKEITLLDKLKKDSKYLRESTVSEEDVVIELPELNGEGEGGLDRMIVLADDANGKNYHFDTNMEMVRLGDNGLNLEYNENFENRSAGLIIDKLNAIQYVDMANE
jgi:hypothetical protein